MHILYLHLAWPNYGLDVLNITMHTEVVIHSMNAYVWCWIYAGFSGRTGYENKNQFSGL